MTELSTLSILNSPGPKTDPWRPHSSPPDSVTLVHAVTLCVQLSQQLCTHRMAMWLCPHFFSVCSQERRAVLCHELYWSPATRRPPAHSPCYQSHYSLEENQVGLTLFACDKAHCGCWGWLLRSPDSYTLAVLDLLYQLPQHGSQIDQFLIPRVLLLGKDRHYARMEVPPPSPEVLPVICEVTNMIARGFKKTQAEPERLHKSTNLWLRPWQSHLALVGFARATG